MFDERRGTLLGPPRRFPGCPRWKGPFKESPVSIRARWKPKGAHESEGGYHIHVSVCSSACSHTCSYPPPPFFFFSSPSLVRCLHSHSSGSTVLLFTGHLCHLAGEVSHFSLRHNLSTSHKHNPPL